MATPSDLNTLASAAKCFLCLSQGQERAIMVYLLDQIAQGSGGGGGGGGGAVTIADGADVTQGALADARAGSPDQATASVIALLRAIFKQTLDSSAALANIVIDTDALVAGISGNVGGFTTLIKDTTAVTVAAYSAGNAVGGKRTLLNALRTAHTGILQSVTILDRSNSKAAMTLFIFDADPAAATITDHAAFVFSTDDLKVIAQVNIGTSDYVTTNGKALATISGLQIPVKAAGTTLWAALVTTGTPTFGATTDVQLEFGILQD